MGYALAHRDAGIDCDFLTRGEAKVRVLEVCTKHINEAHGYVIDDHGDKQIYKTNKIKVLIAGGSEIYSIGLFHSLSEDERIEVFNHVHSGRHVIDMVEQIKPDIILIDSELLNHDEGTGVSGTLQELYPEVNVIVLVYPENIEPLLDKAINAGVRGILPKTISSQELLKSIIDTVELGATIHPTVMPQILQRLAVRQQNKLVVGPLLSEREREITELVAEGKSNRDIAEILFISENTVKGHVRRIRNKLNIDNRIEMARYVLLNGQIEHRENSNGKSLCVE